jgi:mRNA-degrading endonuclease RelE of RelBE toxin-antitoxin system
VRLVVDKVAAKTLAAIQPKIAKAIMARLEAVARDPFARHAGVDRLEGKKDWFRLRRGNWRAIYLIDRIAQEVVVEKIETRGDVYK